MRIQNVCKIDENIRNNIRNTIVKTYSDELKNDKHRLTPFEEPFYMNLDKTKRFLNENPHLFLTNADKGNKNRGYPGILRESYGLHE